MPDKTPSRFAVSAPLAWLTAALLASTQAAAAPRSAIPWLSDILGENADQAEAPIAEPGPVTVQPFDPEPIETSSLGDPKKDGLGLIEAGDAGFPDELWGTASALRVDLRLRAHRPNGVPAARALTRQLLLAKTTPPVGSGADDRILLARIDALMDAGMLEEAWALVELARPNTPALFRRAFDIGLLTGATAERCDQLSASPGLAPTPQARIFCLARAGDWEAADRTLALAAREDSGMSRAQRDLLARFLDPQAFEGQPAPPPPLPLTTLDYMLREAVALPRPADRLPLAFLWPDAHPSEPLKTRISARERLTAAGAIPPGALFAAYRDATPAASGGVWDRVAVVRALDLAFATGRQDDIATALRDADLALAARDLRPALGSIYARQLAAQSPEDYGDNLRVEVASLLLLAGERAAASAWLPNNNRPRARMLGALAAGSAPNIDDTATPLEAAVARGLAAATPPTEDAATIQRLFERGFYGEGLIDILDLLASGTEVDPGDLEVALFLLRAIGQRDIALQIATETVLLLPPA